MQSYTPRFWASGLLCLCGAWLAPGVAAAEPKGGEVKVGSKSAADTKPRAAAPATGAATPAKPGAGVVEAAGEPSAAVLLEAKQRFDRGFDLYDEGEYPLALIEFSRAYELVPNYKVLYNIGQVCIQLGQYANARRALEGYREKGGDGLPKDRRDAVAKDLEMLERRTAFLLITANVAGAEVLVDDVVVGKTPLEPALLVDAGVHRVAVRLQGYLPRQSSVTLAGGDEQTLAITLDVQPEDKPTFVLRDRPVVEEDSNTLMIAGWVTTGALIAGAVVTGIMGAGEADELEQLRGADARDYDDLPGRMDDTKSNASSLFLASDVFSGAALIVGGLSLWITISPLGGESAEAPVEPTPEAKPGVQVGYDEGQLRLRTSF